MTEVTKGFRHAGGYEKLRCKVLGSVVSKGRRVDGEMSSPCLGCCRSRSVQPLTLSGRSRTQASHGHLLLSRDCDS